MTREVAHVFSEQVHPSLHKLVSYDTDDIGQWAAGNGVTFGRSRLATDAVGSCSIRIRNAVTDSRYRIEVASTGALVAEGSVASNDFTVQVPYYATGNAQNALLLKVRKGTSAPKYQPFQTQVEAGPAGALAFISQIPDPIA
jgi:hypothetical protein